MSTTSFPSKALLEIPNDWQLSVAVTEHGPMVIKHNQGFEDLLGHPEYPFQIGVAVPLHSPNENGLHDEEEGEQLGVIEDLLVDSLQDDKLALYVFAQCSAGGKEWVFYTGDPIEAEKRIDAIKRKVASHIIQNIQQPDPNWEIAQSFTGMSHREDKVAWMSWMKRGAGVAVVAWIAWRLCGACL